MGQYLTPILEAVFAIRPLAQQNQPKLTNRIVIFLLMNFTVERVICSHQ